MFYATANVQGTNVWETNVPQETVVLQGTNINIKFVRKTSVEVSDSGSVLTLAPITHQDAGMYQCSLAVGRNTERIVHNVEVIISPELETRNINWQLANKNNSENICADNILLILILFSFYWC